MRFLWDQCDIWLLLQRPLALLAVVARRGEALPVGLVELGKVAAVVVTGPARLLPEEDVARVRLGAVEAVPDLPGAEEIVTITRGHARKILAEHLQELEAALERGTVGDVSRALASHVLVHDLL